MEVYLLWDGELGSVLDGVFASLDLAQAASPGRWRQIDRPPCWMRRTGPGRFAVITEHEVQGARREGFR